MTPMSKELINLIPNNLHNNAENLEICPVVIKDEIENGSFPVQVKEEPAVLPHTALGENNLGSVSMVKMEPEWGNFEIEPIPITNFFYEQAKQEPKLIVPLMETIPPEKNEKCLLDETGAALDGCKEILLNQKELLIKTEKSVAVKGNEQIYDLTFDGWKGKNEELDIKEEDLDPHESSNSYSQGYEVHTVHKSLQCQAKENRNGKRHRFQQTEPVSGRMFQFDQFDSQTVQKSNLKSNLLRHLNSGDINTFKCDQCDYQSVKKQYLTRHLLRHKVPEESNMLKCCHCDFQTIRKGGLKSHLILHKNAEERNLLKCYHCNFQTIHKNSLTVHLLRHPNPGDINKYKCDQCDYQATNKAYLRRHLLQHNVHEKTDIFKCDHCDYHTIYKGNLRNHLVVHKNREERNIFKCYHCDFQTLRKGGLLNHLVVHKNPEERIIFKCSHCDFQSNYKKSLTVHLIRHQNPEEITMFKCDQCDYSAIQRANLIRHLSRHKVPEKTDF